MERDRFGVPRPLVDDGEGPAGFDRPFVGNQEERLIAELENAIGDENSAGVEYQRLINMLMRNGYEQEADVVRDIQQQEMKHKDQFQAILGKVRRDTS